MILKACRSTVLALALLVVTGAATAHHPPRFERCKLYPFTGQIERIEWVNPHVQLYIRTDDDGELLQVGWLGLQALERAGITRETLRAGDHVAIEGGVRNDDIADEPILLSSIRRDSDGWEWVQALQGC